MWLSERKDGQDTGCSSAAVGIVTIGGINPSVLVEGEVRNAEMVCSGTGLIPKAGDEMLLIRSVDGESIAVGKIGTVPPPEFENGEVYITNGSGGVIRLKNSGEIELSGTVIIKGTVEIDGGLIVNGTEVSPTV